MPESSGFSNADTERDMRKAERWSAGNFAEGEELYTQVWITQEAAQALAQQVMREGKTFAAVARYILYNELGVERHW